MTVYIAQNVGLLLFRRNVSRETMYKLCIKYI